MEQLKTRSKVDNIKVRLLSPVREVSGHAIPRISDTLKVAGGHAPICVQAVPQEVNYSASNVKPLKQSNAEVDLIITNYLNLAKSGQPILTDSGEGGTLLCACCRDINRENLQKKFPKRHGDNPGTSSKAKDLPEHHRKQRYLQEHNSHTLGRSSFSSSDYVPHVSGGISSQYTSDNPVSIYHNLGNWDYYQPVPNAGTFLNPEFNRPFVRQLQNMTTRDIAKQRFITRKITEASDKYEHNMRKLQENFENCFVLPEGVVYLRGNKNDVFDPS